MANATPVQTYYVPIREDQTVIEGDGQGHVEIGMGSSLQDVDTFSLISFGIAAENTIVTYDNWEDGYELNAAAPTQVDGDGNPTTFVWGDGDASNNGVYISVLDKNNDGVVSDAEDVFLGGEAFNITDVVELNRGPDDIYFDGSDKISATFPISVSRLSAPIENSNDSNDSNDSIRNIATGAVEVQDTSKFGSEYIIPVGGDGSGNTDAPTGAFDLAFAHVLAAQNGTSVYLNGQLVATLDEGETYVAAEVVEGDRITTYDPATATDGPGAQVTLITRDNGSQDNEQRWYSLSPVEDWSNDYVTPVGVGVNFDASSPSSTQGASRVWLYNDADTAIEVEMQTRNPSTGVIETTTITVPAGGSVKSDEIPDGSGARFTSDADDPFYAVLQVDARGGGARNDWGHPLIPVDQLTSQGLVTFGYGNTKQLTDGNSNESRSVTFVTALEDATINVDYNGDGTVDTQIDAKAMESVTITDPSDVNMTGALIFATDANGDPVDIAIAHGQDPGQSAPESQSIDAGVVTIPLPEVFTSKVATLVDDADNNGVYSTGDTVEFTITTLNFGRVDIAEGGYVVTDDYTSFASVVDYVDGSTTYDLSDGRGEIALDDSSSATAFPLDEGFNTTGRGDGTADSATLNVDEAHTLTFRGVIKDFDELAAGTVGFVNEGTLANNTGGVLNDFSTNAPIVFDAGVDIETTTNGVDADTGTGPSVGLGATVVWRYAVSNTGETFLSAIALADDQGEVPAYVSGDGNGNDLIDPGETWIYEATGTAEDGQYRNVGSVSATPTYADGTPVPASAGGGTVSDSDPSAYFGLDKPSIAFSKSVVDVAGRGADGIVEAAGDVITYKLVVTNDGAVELTNVVVKDDLTGFETTIAKLAEGASQTMEVTYQATQDDIDTNGGGDGDIDNVAVVDSDQTDVLSDDAEVLIDYAPEMALEKTASVASVSRAGDEVDYLYTVTNEGNTTLTNVEVKDDNATPGDTSDDFYADYVEGDSNGNGFLDLDESWIFGKTVSVTQEQIDAGSALTNVATASTDEAGPVVDDATVDVDANASLVFRKKILKTDEGTGTDDYTNGNGVLDAAGDVIVYRLFAKNTGDTTLTDVELFDPLTGGFKTIDELAPGEKIGFKTSYTLTQDDIDDNGGGDGDIDNTATADSNQTDEVAASVAAPLVHEPSIAIDKEVLSVDADGDGVANEVDNVIRYLVTVTNTGNVTLTDVVVTDPLTGMTEVIPSLEPGASQSFEVEYAVTPEDLQTNGGGDGIVNDFATADSNEAGPVSDDAPVPLVLERMELCTDIDDEFVMPRLRDATIQVGEGLPHQNGTNDDDVIFGDGTANTISTNDGNNQVRGRGGDDIVNGGNFKDLIFGENGNDILNGNNGNDSLSGGNGADKIYGASGHDMILAGKGADLVEAGSGNDRIDLGQGNDTVQGEGGRDCIRGGEDNGRITVAADGDLIVKLGDEMWGNGGADKFEYVEGDGVDFLFDFKAAKGDTLDLFGLDADDLSFVTAETSYGPAAGIAIDKDGDGEFEGGIFFQQLRNPDDVAALVDNGTIELFI